MHFVKLELIPNKPASVPVDVVSKLKAENYIPVYKFDIGSEAKKIMKELKADSTQQATYKTLCMDVTKVFEKSVAYLVKKLPLADMLLKNVACLSPLVRQQPASLQMIQAVVDQLPYCNSTQIKDDVLREWQCYRCDSEIVDEFHILETGQNADGTGFVKYRRVDEFWHKVMQLTDLRGQPKYPALAKVVKITLCLSHGQADVERGFSLNKRLLNDRSQLSEKSICAARTVKEVIALHKSISDIPITPTLLAAYRKAHRLYKEDLRITTMKSPSLKCLVRGKQTQMLAAVNWKQKS